MSTELTFKIVGSDDDRGMVEFVDFVRFCESVHECLRASEAIVSGQAGKISYRITDLRCESATIKVQAVRGGSSAETRKETVKFFRNTVADLERGRIDPRLPPSALSSFRELASPLKRNAKRVVIGRVNVTVKLDKTIGKLLDDSISSEGQVTGMLERLNVHDRNEFIIYPPLIGGQVTCSFPECMLDEVRSAIKRNVTVSGTQFYAVGSVIPSRIHVTDLEVHPADDELPTLRDVRELGHWDTGNLSAVEFARALRDE